MQKLGIFNNLGLKLISLVVAAGVWFFVVIVNKPELNLVVPVKFENVPPNMALVGDERPELQVRVKGNQNALSSLGSRRIVASLDLSRVPAGEHTFHLSARQINLPPGVQVNRIVPGQVKVRLEPLMERLLPVEAVVLGVPAEGYELREVAVFPKTVRVLGAKSKVEELESVRTASLNITGFDSSVTRELELLPLPDKLRLAEGASGAVQVRAIIAEKNEERQFSVPIQINPPSWSAVFEPAAVKIKARGPISKIRALKATEITAVISLLSLAPEQEKVPIRVQLPADITLLEQEPAEVSLSSVEKPLETELLRPTIGNGLPNKLPLAP